MKPQHDLRAGEALIRHDHKITDPDGAFWGDVADMLNSAASRFDQFDIAVTMKPSPRETRELNRLVSMANRYMAAHGLNEDGSYNRAGILAMLSGLSMLASDAERLFERVKADGRFEFDVRRDAGGRLIEGWMFELTREGAGWDIAELAHEVTPQPEAQPPLPPVGHRWTDNDGFGRIKTPWGFNAFADERGARAQAADLGRPGSHWYIWQLDDGSYDATSSANPQTPGHPARLISEVEIRRVSGHLVAVSVNEADKVQ